MKQPKLNFIDFLEKFPEVELPVFLGPESHHDFSQKNEPLPQVMTDWFIAPFEEDEVDELTEFIPCFRIPETYEFYAIVYCVESFENSLWPITLFVHRSY